MGICDGKIYFQTKEDREYNVQIYDINSGNITSVLKCRDDPAVLCGGDLFYAEKSSNGTTLHRSKVSSNVSANGYRYEYGYDYALFFIDVYMEGRFCETGDKVYVTGFKKGSEKNSREMIALDWQSGAYEFIGTWTDTES